MFLRIDDAPFTDQEKQIIKDMGVMGADWGHPQVVLDDPVAYFKKRALESRSTVKPGGAGLTHYEEDQDDNPLEKA